MIISIIIFIILFYICDKIKTVKKNEIDFNQFKFNQYNLNYIYCYLPSFFFINNWVDEIKNKKKKE